MAKRVKRVVLGGVSDDCENVKIEISWTRNGNKSTHYYDSKGTWRGRSVLILAEILDGAEVEALDD